jgi:hypothetical protein
VKFSKEMVQVNDILPYTPLSTCGAIIIIVLIWKVSHDCIRTLRTIISINDPNQRWFAKPSFCLSALKRHIVYAPILEKRHAQGMQLNSKMKTGCFPTRLQLLVMLIYLGINVALTTIQMHSNESHKSFTTLIRRRLGILTTLNMASSQR